MITGRSAGVNAHSRAGRLPPPQSRPTPPFRGTPNRFSDPVPKTAEARPLPMPSVPKSVPAALFRVPFVPSVPSVPFLVFQANTKLLHHGRFLVA